LRLIYYKAYTIEGAACELNIAANDLKAKLQLATEPLNALAI
jgi:hypothetical protein